MSEVDQQPRHPGHAVDCKCDICTRARMRSPTSKEVTFLPCPFCGSQPESHSYVAGAKSFAWVRCNSCRIDKTLSTDGVDPKLQAMVLTGVAHWWNGRATPELQPAASNGEAVPVAEYEQHIELTRELEREGARQVVGDVMAIAGERTDTYWAAHSQACEEILHRLQALWGPSCKHCATARPAVSAKPTSAHETPRYQPPQLTDTQLQKFAREHITHGLVYVVYEAGEATVLSFEDVRLDSSVETPDSREVLALRWLAESADPDKLTGWFAVDHARRALGLPPLERPSAETSDRHPTTTEVVEAFHRAYSRETSPKPASIDDLIALGDKFVLPVDVKIGAGTFKKGVPVGTMLRCVSNHARYAIADAYSGEKSPEAHIDYKVPGCDCLGCELAQNGLANEVKR